ncbi:MAG: hypothetical protein U5L02_04285 [Rheinheimera sp.]|nr:hypothetical protein [Rheinheimera sp.]
MHNSSVFFCRQFLSGVLCGLFCLAFALEAAPIWHAKLEQIQVQSKSQPREANIQIEQWLSEINPAELELREQLINTKAYNLIILSEHSSAEQLLQSWREEVQASAPARTTRALELSGYIAMRRGEHAKASQMFKLALQQATDFIQPERQITARIYTAMQAMQTGQHDVALAVLLQAKALNARQQFPYLQVNIANNLSTLYLDMGKNAEALPILTAALADPAFQPADLLYVRMNLARCYLSVRSNPGAGAALR